MVSVVMNGKKNSVCLAESSLHNNSTASYGESPFSQHDHILFFSSNNWQAHSYYVLRVSRNTCPGIFFSYSLSRDHIADYTSKESFVQYAL